MMGDYVEVKTFGKWTVLGISESKRGYYTCKCSCGTVKEVCASTLNLGKSNSCGRCRSDHKKIEVGDEFMTNQGSKCVVVEYNGAFDVLVRFLDESGYVKSVSTGDLRRGEVSNPFFPSVFGVGYIGLDKNSLKGYKAGKSREHMFWKGMMERCYSDLSLKRSPSYAGCTVDSRWHNFQNFAAWCQDQVGFSEQGWQLDKDLLADREGPKVYSPDVCVFVPQEVNTLFATGVRRGGDSLMGVSYCKDRGNYQAGCGVGGTRVALGRFSTPELAHEAYLKAKKARVSAVLDKYKGRVDNRVSDLLSKFIED
jgi:hypothetical protein